MDGVWSSTTMSPRKPAAVTTHVALLRGINVGGKNLVPMKALAQLFADAGCSDVRTYIASGNVVFAAAPKLVAGLAAGVQARIGEQFGLTVPVVLRSAEELAQVVARNPFLRAGVDPERLHVSFLAEQPSARAAASLDPHRSPPDEFALVGREIYLHLPNGAGQSKLTNAYFDGKLGTVSTARNWRTVTKLIDMAGA
jgi:uncharacterized protein (DUF1697 family)